MVGRTNPEEVEREVRRLKDVRLRRVDEVRRLEAAGWTRRGIGPKRIWRKPDGGRWYAHYQALDILRKEGPTTPDGDE